MNSIVLLAGAAAQGGNAGASGQGGSPIGLIIMMVALFAIMYFMMIRPQKKKQKEEQSMRDNIQVGDEITTIGGIMGRVVTVKEDSLIIETGADRNKMKIARWAVSANNTANEKAEAERKRKSPAGPFPPTTPPTKSLRLRDRRLKRLQRQKKRKKLRTPQPKAKPAEKRARNQKTILLTNNKERIKWKT